MNPKRQTHTIRTEEHRDRVARMVASLDMGKAWDVEVAPHVKSRSVQQNKLYHKWVGIMADHTGYSHDEMHHILAVKFLPPQIVEYRGEVHEFRMSTTRLSVAKMDEYMKRVEAHALTEGILLPDFPNGEYR